MRIKIEHSCYIPFIQSIKGDNIYSEASESFDNEYQLKFCGKDGKYFRFTTELTEKELFLLNIKHGLSFIISDDKQN